MARWSKGDSHGGRRATTSESFLHAVTRAEPLGEMPVDGVESLRDGEARGLLVGGTLTQLVASLGTPFAFDPPSLAACCSSTTSRSGRTVSIGC